jgi:cell division protein FtsL
LKPQILKHQKPSKQKLLKPNKKIKAFTLSEMIIVLILTSIVVGLAFSVLSLVQKQMHSIKQNFNKNTELNKLEIALHVDFSRYSKINYDDLENEIKFMSPIDSISYQFYDDKIIKDLDTFNIQLQNKLLFFDGEAVMNGEMDAIKLVTSKDFQNKALFIYKKNDASNYMD